jgi:hypothetical protein
MILKDAVIDMHPAPCGAVAIAAHLGLKVTWVIAHGFLAPGLPVWGTWPADLDTAFRRFGRSLCFVGRFRDDGLPPLEEFLEYRMPFLRAAPFVAWVEDGTDDGAHWIAVWREWIATDGRWRRVEDMPAGQWWARAVWSVKGR